MWGAGLILITMSSFQKNQGEYIAAFHQNKIRAITKPRSTNAPEDIQRILTRYLDEIFPTVFQTQSYLSRMIEEVTKHHRYVSLLSNGGRDLKMKRIVTCVHLLTIQSMLMCMLAVLYDLQVPFTHCPFLSLDSSQLMMELAALSRQAPHAFASPLHSTPRSLNALGNSLERIFQQPKIIFASIILQQFHLRFPIFFLPVHRTHPV